MLQLLDQYRQPAAGGSAGGGGRSGDAAGRAQRLEGWLLGAKQQIAAALLPAPAGPLPAGPSHSLAALPAASMAVDHSLAAPYPSASSPTSVFAAAAGPNLVQLLGKTLPLHYVSTAFAAKTLPSWLR